MSLEMLNINLRSINYRFYSEQFRHYTNYSRFTTICFVNQKFKFRKLRYDYAPIYVHNIYFIFKA